jgi:hypothetical protein
MDDSVHQTMWKGNWSTWGSVIMWPTIFQLPVNWFEVAFSCAECSIYCPCNNTHCLHPIIYYYILFIHLLSWCTQLLTRLQLHHSFCFFVLCAQLNEWTAATFNGTFLQNHQKKTKKNYCEGACDDMTLWNFRLRFEPLGLPPLNIHKA